MSAYDLAQEVNDLDSLDELVMDPDEMRMQALLIRERILGPVHPDTSYYIRFRQVPFENMLVEFGFFLTLLVHLIGERFTPIPAASIAA